MRERTLGLAVVLALAVSIGAMSAGAVTSHRAVVVTLSEFNLVPASQGAPAGKVTFAVTNAGKLEHEFVVVKTSRPAGSLLKGDEANEAGNVGEIGSVKPGQTKKVALKLTAGHYSLICNLAGHYKAGQFADFYIR
jgi:uncharacterized cupredoxin-like copper-binding protein